MLWHNGLNWKKYLARRERQREVYRQAGMTEEQIAAIEEFDEEVLRSDRRFYMHCCPHHEADSPEKTPEPAAGEAGGIPAGTRLGWFDELGDPDLTAFLKRLPPAKLRLVELLFVRGCSQRRVARMQGCTVQSIGNQWQQIRRDAEAYILWKRMLRASGQEERSEEEEAALLPIGQSGGVGQLADQEAEALQGGVEPLGEAAGRVGPGAGPAADAALVAQEEE